MLSPTHAMRTGSSVSDALSAAKPTAVPIQEKIRMKVINRAVGCLQKKVAIFRGKMSGFRMFSGFRERETRRNP